MKKFFVLLVSVAVWLTAGADLRLAPLFGNGMVLQQKQQANIWGWAAPKASVTIKASWGAKASAKADSPGRWRTTLATPAATFEQQTVTVCCGRDKAVLTDVLIGEVWFASGQSNMEMPLKGFDSCPTEGSNEAIAESGRFKGKIHFVTVPSMPQAEPTDTVTVKWEDCTPATSRDFCAAAYFFGIKLQQVLNCPVGLINSSLGATRVEGWMPRELLRSYPDVNIDAQIDNLAATIAGMKSRNEDLYDIPRHLPLVFYNGMIHPFVGYNIKGFLWYQGEANVTYQCYDYARRMTDMVREWRSLWGMGDLPFYYVEICPYGWWWAKPELLSCVMREQQLQAQSMLPNMGMVCTNDLVKDYEYGQIHPCMKREVGERLCYWALNQAYGITGISCQYPIYKSMEVKDGKAYVTFSNADEGFDRGSKIEGFEICGPDSVFYPATYVGAGGNRVTVQASQVKQPVAVRYCYKPFQVGNLKSLYGLPVVPFRTDDFPIK